MAQDHEGRGLSREILTHDPMASSAAAHEADLVGLCADPEEQAICKAPPTDYDDSVGRVDADIAGHSRRSLNGCGP